jgi:F0F1-type ATP synthase membrane subunit b/b'
MKESWKTSTASQPSTPTAGLGERPERSSAAEAKEAEPFAQAASQIAELMQRFVEEVGAVKRDAQVAADSARTAHADAERIRLEAIKQRADAEAEAIRIIDGARVEADGIREEAETRAAVADRLYRGIADDLERAQEILGAAIDRVGADVGEPTVSEYGAVMPDAPGEAAAQSQSAFTPARGSGSTSSAKD